MFSFTSETLEENPKFLTHYYNFVVTFMCIQLLNTNFLTWLDCTISSSKTYFLNNSYILALTNVVLLYVAEVAINWWIAKKHHHDRLSISVVHYVSSMSLHGEVLRLQHRTERPEGPGTATCIKQPQFICYVPGACLQLPTKHVDIILQRAEKRNEDIMRSCASIWGITSPQAVQKRDTNFPASQEQIFSCVNSQSIHCI